MNTLNPQFLLMGWLFAKNTVFILPNKIEINNCLMDLNETLLQTPDNFYLIPKMED